MLINNYGICLSTFCINVNHRTCGWVKTALNDNVFLIYVQALKRENRETEDLSQSSIHFLNVGVLQQSSAVASCEILQNPNKTQMKSCLWQVSKVI